MKSRIALETKSLFLVGAGKTLLVFPKFTDPVNLPKFILLMSMSFALATHSKIINNVNFRFDYVREKCRYAIHEPMTISLFLFVVGLFVSTIFSKSPMMGLFGLSGRRNGFLTYLSLFMIFLVAKKVSNWDSLHHYVQVLALVGVVQAMYMLIQYLGLDPLPWNTVHENKMFGTFGNPNFSSAFLAISFPAALYCAFSKLVPKIHRYIFALATIAILVAISLCGVYQGPIALVASIAVGSAIYLQKFWVSRFKWISTAVFIAVSITTVLGMFKVGPLAAVFAKGTFELRSKGYWPIAADIGMGNPFFGIGPEQFINYFPKVFTPELKERFGQISSDNAHNYILHFFAEGGLVVFLPYLGYLLLFSIAISLFCLKSNSENRFLLFTLMGIWIAYLGQSMVSIDNMGISIWIWILSGLIVGLKQNLGPTDRKEITSNKKKVSFRNQNQNQIKAKSDGAKLPIYVGIAITLVLTPLVLLDNKVWNLENSLRTDSGVLVTREDLDSLFSRGKLWPFDPTLLSRSSSILLSYGLNKEGFELLNKVTSLNYDSPSIWNLRAAATESILNRQLAAPIRARELELDPWNEESSIQYIRDLISLNDIAKAESEFERLKKFSSEANILIAREVLTLKIGN
jgi:O-antigen ligase